MQKFCGSRKTLYNVEKLLDKLLVCLNTFGAGWFSPKNMADTVQLLRVYHVYARFIKHVV